MKKKVVIGVCALLAVVLLFPIRSLLDDGGTVEYNAVLYRVQKLHRLAPADSEQTGYFEGTVVEILGLTVWNHVELSGTVE